MSESVKYICESSRVNTTVMAAPRQLWVNLSYTSRGRLRFHVACTITFRFQIGSAYRNPTGLVCFTVSREVPIYPLLFNKDTFNPTASVFCLHFAGVFYCMHRQGRSFALCTPIGGKQEKKKKMAAVQPKSCAGRIKSVFIKQQGIYEHFSWYHNTHKTRGIPVSTSDSKLECYCTRYACL